MGIAILYLSFYAAFGFYHLLEPAFAFILMATTTAMAGVFALRYDALPIAVLGLLGGYATPIPAQHRRGPPLGAVQLRAAIESRRAGGGALPPVEEPGSAGAGGHHHALRWMAGG